MAARTFRTDQSISAEQATRRNVEALLIEYGFAIQPIPWVVRGTAITQIISGNLPQQPPMRMHVRLCWRRDGRNRREELYSAAQLRARLIDDDWDKTLAMIADREARDGNTHLLLVQPDSRGFAFAAIIPCDQIPRIMERQREVSDDLAARGLRGTLTKNHVVNGASPTIWLQDDRFPATGAVANVLWNWPGVINVMALPRQDGRAVSDTFDDLNGLEEPLGRDGAERTEQIRSGYPRDPKVRAAVRARANGACERRGCDEHRPFAGFLDVHHILGVGVSDRVWSCVALCPNCHREAHFSPDREAINLELRDFASQWAE